MQVWHSLVAAFALAAFGTLWFGGPVWLAMLVGLLWTALSVGVFAAEGWWRYWRHHH